METKRKIIAILAVLLLCAIPFNVAQAGEIQNQETISVEVGDINENGNPITETYLLSEEQLAGLEAVLSEITQKIASASSLEEIEKIIQNIPIKNGIIGTIISKIISMITTFIRRIINTFRAIFDRSLVISSGNGYKLNPFRHSELFRITKRFVFWHYSNRGAIRDRTVIFTLRGLRMRILTGGQIGWMRNFFGLYIYIARSFPQMSYTFFFGTARRVNGIRI